MRPVTELTVADLKNIKLLAFDSDGVLVKKGTDITQTTDGSFTQKTNFVSDEVLDKLNQLKKHFEIVINSGRNSLYLSQIYQSILWNNVTLISEIGIFLTGDGFHIQTLPLDNYELTTIINIRKKLSLLLGDPRVKGFEPKQFLTTLHCYQSVPEVDEIVKESDRQNLFYCWWNEEAYDINPKKFTKLSALTKLISLKNLTAGQVITVGNGINDRDLTAKGILNISTDANNLTTDDYLSPGEHLGGMAIINHLLKLIT